jgi:hypothetical protein
MRPCAVITTVHSALLATLIWYFLVLARLANPNACAYKRVREWVSVCAWTSAHARRVCASAAGVVRGCVCM